MCDWKHLESQIAKYQKMENITPFDMINIISLFRRSKNDNMFDLQIRCDNCAVSREMSHVYKTYQSAKYYKETIYTMVLIYEKVNIDTNLGIWNIIKDKIKQIQMRGTTFYITLKI